MTPVRRCPVCRAPALPDAPGDAPGDAPEDANVIRFACGGAVTADPDKPGWVLPCPHYRLGDQP